MKGKTFHPILIMHQFIKPVIISCVLLLISAMIIAQQANDEYLGSAQQLSLQKFLPKWLHLSVTRHWHRYNELSLVNLTRFNTSTMAAIQDWLVVFSLAPMLAKPYPTLAWPNLPSIGLRSPGLTGFDNASLLGRPRGLAISLMSFSFNHFLFSRVQ